MSDQYRGRVRSVNTSGRTPFAYVDEKTVEPLDGSPVLDIREGEGIFVHSENCNQPLRLGMELIFDVEPDERRNQKLGAGCFRAYAAYETSASKLKHLTEGGIRLSTPDNELQDATFFVTWCLTPEVAASVSVKRIEGQAVRLLIVHYTMTGDENNPTANERRMLVDLNSMAALSFNAVGKHRVVAAIVSSSDYSKLHDRYLNKSEYGYVRDLVEHAGDALIYQSFFLGTGCFDAVIPEGVLAKEPFDYKWVNSYFKKPPKDECRYFWFRRVPVYLLQLVRLPYIGIASMIKLIIAALIILVLLGLGMRGVAIRTMLRHPYKTPLGYVWANLQGTRFLRRTEDNRYDFSPVVFSPVLWLCVAAAVVLYAKYSGSADIAVGSVDWQGLGKTIGGALLTVALTLIVLAGLTYWVQGVKWGENVDVFSDRFTEMFFEGPRQRRFKRFLEKKARRQQEAAIAEARRRERIAQETAALVCAVTGPRLPGPQGLRFTPQTLYFRLVDWKRKRCRNFSAT